MFRRQRPRKAAVTIPKRKWKTTKLHPKDWDSTISDLTVHKATEEEVQRRQIIHKSKNASAARRALGERAKMLFMDSGSPGQVELEMRKLAILKEVLYDHDDLNEVLKRVDNTMSSVKTIFHDAPYRKSGIPNVTLAPGSKAGGDTGPVQLREEQQTQLSLLSDSVMDKQALNDEALSSEEEDEDEESEKFESKVDYERFLGVLRESLNKAVVPPKESCQGADPKTPVNDSISQRQALNCTKEVKRTMARFGNSQKAEKECQDSTRRKIDETIGKATVGNPPLQENKKRNQTVSFSVPGVTSLPPPRRNLSVNSMTYEGLQEAMGSVTLNLSKLENRRGVKTPEIADTSLKGDGLAGFTATLIDAVTRLTVYVNEAEGKIADTESRLESLKSQNDHLRALVDALTAELMSTQDLIKSAKEEGVKRLEGSQKKEEEWKERFEKEMQEMKKQMEALAENKETITASGDGSQHGSTTHIFDAGKLADFQVLEADRSKKAKDQEEEALKSDMLSLLGALKSQNTKPLQEQTQETLFMPMNNRTTEGAAQTVATVESQLRHLQLQHAEAQNRLQELTQVAGFLAGKVAETERSQSSASSESSNHVPDQDKMLEESSSSASIESGPITPRPFAEHSGEGFQFMVPTSGNDTDDAVSGFTITSSLFATTGGDYPGPSDLSSRIGLNEASPVLRTRISGPGTSSSESLDISDHSFKDVPKNVPALLQTNVFGIKQRPKSGDTVSSLLHHLNTKNAESSALPPFKPTGAPVVSEPSAKHVVTSIQQTQCNLEDRIAELNKQHAEAQSRLHKLIRKKTDVRSPSSVSSGGSRVIQVTLPTADMLQTPQIHKPPEPFRPLNVAEDSFE